MQIVTIRCLRNIFRHLIIEEALAPRQIIGRTRGGDGPSGPDPLRGFLTAMSRAVVHDPEHAHERIDTVPGS